MKRGWQIVKKEPRCRLSPSADQLRSSSWRTLSLRASHSNGPMASEAGAWFAQDQGHQGGRGARLDGHALAVACVVPHRNSGHGHGVVNSRLGVAWERASGALVRIQASHLEKTL